MVLPLGVPATPDLSLRCELDVANHTLAVRVTGAQQTYQPLVLVGGESLACDRQPVRRARLAERGSQGRRRARGADGGVPGMRERWLRWDVPGRVDEMFTELLASEIEVATRHFDSNLTAA